MEVRKDPKNYGSSEGGPVASSAGREVKEWGSSEVDVPLNEGGTIRRYWVRRRIGKKTSSDRASTNGALAQFGSGLFCGSWSSMKSPVGKQRTKPWVSHQR